MKKLAVAGLATIVSTAAFADASVDFYGTLKGDFVQTDKMNNPDAQAVFATAKGTGYSDFDKASQRTMSFRETLLGAKFSNGSKLKGQLEIDFNGEEDNTAGITRSSTGVMRFRQAFLTYQVSDKGEINFGKKWAAFQGVNPHTMSNNLYGFYQGNTGFISDVLNYKHNFGNLHATFELGASDTQGDTGTITDASTQASRTNKISTPSQTIRLDYMAGEHLVGLVHAMAEKNTKDALGASDNVSITASKIFFEGNFDKTQVRAEYATGVNATGHGWLTKTEASKASAVASGGDDVEETAMWLSANHDFGAWNLFVRYGKAEVTNADELFDQGDISMNTATALGASFNIDEGTQAYLEYTQVTTDRLTANQTSDTDSDTGSVINLGMQYMF